jgi:very-short-patch-repair endonuclease
MAYTRFPNEAKQSLSADPAIRKKAQELRKSMTPCEKILWKYLRERRLNGLHFRRQHPYGIYILDFYCSKACLSIEVDGPIHLGIGEYDEERTRFIESTGIKELRFSNDDILHRIKWVIDEIKKNT